jgi:serine/threonine protein kinase/Tfp pilus assembly protein PilF
MIGKKISHYEILEKIGSGGMGVVYKAEDTQLKRYVALKFLPTDMTRDEEAKARFVHEAQAASALDHPNICTIYEISQTPDGQNFIAMAYYEGETLKDKIIPRGMAGAKDKISQKDGPAHRRGLNKDEAIDITIQIANGLQKAHKKGIVHRDIKPANIIITNDGMPKILDFGLAKLTNQTMLTKAGMTIGTISYMSPEQTRGEQVDQRSDIWSLGVMFYEMLTGTLPFKGEYEQAIIYSILNEEPEKPTNLNQEIAPELEEIMLKALHKDPQQRFQNMKEMLDDLKAATGVIVPKGRKKYNSKKYWLVFIPLVLLLLLFSPQIINQIKSIMSGSSGSIQSIAVLPLKNLTGDPGQDYFCDGMTDALISELNHIGAMRVISRQSTRQYKNSNKSMAQIAKELNVDAIIDATFLRSSDHAQINANLIDPYEDRHLWTQRFDFYIADIFQFYKDFTKAIISEIKIQLTPAQTSRLAIARKIDPNAYETYLRGISFSDQYTSEGFLKAEHLFKEALAMDSTFAPAYAGLSRVYTFIGTGYSGMEALEALGKSRLYAEKALQFDNELAEAYIALGNYHLYAWNWQESEKYLFKATKLSPNDATAHQFYSHVLTLTGKFKDGIFEIDLAHHLDPLSLGINIQKGWPYYLSDNYDKAKEIFSKVLEINPNFALGQYNMGLTYYLKGMYPEALQFFKRAVDLDSMQCNFRAIYACGLYKAGFQSEAKKILEIVKNRVPPCNHSQPTMVAYIYNSMGKTDSTFLWLETAYNEHNFMLMTLKNEPLLKNIKHDPRYQELLKKMGLLYSD